MLNIGIFCELQDQNFSFYRAWGPFIQLRRQCKDINLIEPGNNPATWNFLGNIDIAFFQRPSDGFHLACLMACKQAGAKIWVDWDDDFFNVPRENVAWYRYIRPEIHENMRNACRVADVVTVQSKYLLERFKDFNPFTQILPNAYDEELFNRLRRTEKKNEKIICWRGGATHRRDLDFAHDSLVEVSKEFPDWKWVFIGTPEILYRITEGVDPELGSIRPTVVSKKVALIEPKQIYEHFQDLMSVQPDIQVVPLADTDFNRGKSNIAWIESTACGASVLAPNLDEWVKPGITNYELNSVDDFKEQLRWMMKNPEILKDRNKESSNYIQSCLTLKKVNATRMRIIERLGFEVG